MSTHKRIGSGAILCLPILLQCMTAMAAEDNARSSAPSEPRAPGDWSIVAGLGFAKQSYGLEPYRSWGPSLGVTLERRLGRHTWVLLGAGGQYFAPTYESRYWVAEGHTGLRYVFNPGKAFEFSSYVVTGASHSRYSDDELGQRRLSIGFHGTLGITVDRELTDGVGVRISSGLASSGWSYTADEYRDGLDDRHYGGFYGAIGLQPSVELRMTF